MRTNRTLVGLLWLLASGISAAEPATPHADLVIRRAAGSSEIQVRTTARLAGAVHSLTWNGQEFIDSADHGRQLQSASSFSSDGQHWAEAFNPTEAGSRDDGAGPTSTSRLLHSVATGDSLQTTTQMAFWLSPGQKSDEHPAINITHLSNHLLTKRVQIGLPDLPHVIRHDVTFTVPLNERHTFAQFEALTGYMPEEFRSFWTFRPQTGELKPLSFGPGEQPFPVVLSTESGSHAMGIYSPQQPSVGFENAGYGRWRFERERVVKWNTVFRHRRADGIEPGEYSFRNFVVIGDRETVRTSLIELHRRFPSRHLGERGGVSPPVRSHDAFEGLNHKVKLTTRKSYGFRTDEAVETALFHNLGALPEPEFTHRFW